MNDSPEDLQPRLDSADRGAVRAGVPQNSGKAFWNEELTDKFIEDRAIAIPLKKRSRKGRPVFAGKTNQLE